MSDQIHTQNPPIPRNNRHIHHPLTPRISPLSIEVWGSFTLIGMVSEISTEIQRLRALRSALSRAIYTLQSVDSKDDIFALLAQYRDSLDFVRQELEFEHGVSIVNASSIPEAVEYDALREFLELSQKSLIQRQLALRQGQLEQFEDLKREKYITLIEQVPEEVEQSPQLPISQDAKIINTTRKITSKLIASSQILQSSLVQSHLNLDELEIQGDSLNNYAERNDLVGSVLSKSEVFINDIRLSGARDKQRMYYALGFFALCVLKVFWGRVFKWPVLIVWRLTWFVIRGAFGLKGKVGGPLSVQQTTADMIVSETLTDLIATATKIILEASRTATQALISETSNGQLTGETLDEALGRVIDEL